MSGPSGSRRAAVGAALGLSLALALSLPSCGGREPGYPGEPVDGVGAVAWLGPPGEGFIRSEGRPAALGMDFLKFEALVAPIPGLVSTFSPEPYEAVLGVPAELPNHFLFHDRRLVAAVLSVDAAGMAALRARFGEPHREWTTGPYTDSIWSGKVADVQIRTGGQIGNTEDGLVFLSHRAACAELMRSAGR